MKKDSPKELNDRVMDLVNKFDVSELLQDMELVGSGQRLEVMNDNVRPNLYYQWLSCLVKFVKPKQIVELGAASGVSTICMAKYMPASSKLYSVDIDPSIAWKWMSKSYPQVVKIIGDDLNMGIWPGNVDLGKTEIWFLDTLHTGEQLSKEVELYSPLWKKGAIVIFDDIHLNEGMEKVWDGLKYNKLDISIPCHYSGFGFLTI